MYVARNNRDMNPYLKGLNLMLNIWRPYRDKEEWILWGEELNMAELDGKWEGMEEVNKLNLVIGVTRLR